MNRSIPAEIIDEIRLRCNIVELINSYLPLKKSGSGTWKARCPFHDEKTPSFVVNENRNRFHCFGCGKGGDIFSFVMEWEKVDFPNAAHLLAAKCNIIIPEKTYSSPEERSKAKEQANAREKLYAINEKFAAWFHELLLSSQKVGTLQDYVASRNIPQDAVKTFSLGASLDSWDACLQQGHKWGFSREELITAGIALKSETSGKTYDRFRNRLVFPIWNEQGRVVGFSARTIDPESNGAKYVNTPETPIFKKGHILYALPLARKAIQKENKVILCEGQLDVIAMHNATLNYSVAPQGTAFTEQQAKLLKRYTDRVFIAFDSDSAGQKATLRAIELLLPFDIEVKVISFEAGSDPDSILQKQGKEALCSFVDNAIDWFDFLFEIAAKQFDPQTPHGKKRIFDFLKDYLQKLSQTMLKELYLQKLGEKLGVASLNLKQLESPQATPFRPENKPVEKPAIEIPIPPNIEHAEKTLLEIGLAYESVAAALAHSDRNITFSQTPIGHALNELINCVLNGEWHHAMAHLNDFERQHHSPTLSHLLVTECSFSEKNANKALTQCLNCIEKHSTTEEKNALLLQLKTAPIDQQREILLKLQQLNKA